MLGHAAAPARIVGADPRSPEHSSSRMAHMCAPGPGWGPGAAGGHGRACGRARWPEFDWAVPLGRPQCRQCVGCVCKVGISHNVLCSMRQVSLRISKLGQIGPRSYLGSTVELGSDLGLSGQAKQTLAKQLFIYNLV